VRSFVLLLTIATATAMAPASRAGGALDRFEQAHRPSSSPERSSSDSDDDDDDDDDDASGFDSSDDYDSSLGESEGDSDGDGGAIGLIVLCAIPPILFACVHPSHRVSRQPYDDDGHYIEPVGDRSEDSSLEPTRRVYLRAQQERFRWAELSLSGFRAFNEAVVYSHDLELMAWLGPVVPHLRWEHFYEEIQDTGQWDHLDRFGLHIGSNVLGPWVEGMEAYLLAGVGVLHGEEWTPAFEAALDLRIYPVEPLAIRPSATLSVFGIGPVLLDARLEAGVALGPLEIRLGPRWLYQGQAQGFWGPSAALVGRL
jgi:hypothetical protein